MYSANISCLDRIDTYQANISISFYLRSVVHCSQDAIIEETIETEYVISCDEVMSAANTLIRWCEEREIDLSNVLNVERHPRKIYYCHKLS